MSAARWTVIVPVKTRAAAKTRLTGVPDREALAVAFALDTIAAAAATSGVTRVVVVTDADGTCWPGADRVLTQVRPGLDGAVLDGAALSPDGPVAVLLGDLPALTPDELAPVLAAAALHALGLVPDAAGSGTAVLTAARGALLVPRFGVGSAGRHRSVGHVDLPAGPRVRRDVDTAADLADAVRLGVGPATRARLAAVGLLES